MTPPDTEWHIAIQWPSIAMWQFVHRPPAALTRSSTRRGTSASMATRPSLVTWLTTLAWRYTRAIFSRSSALCFVEFEGHAPGVELELLGNRVDHVLAASVLERRDAERFGMHALQPLDFARLDQVALVEDVHRGHIGGAHFLEHAS